MARRSKSLRMGSLNLLLLVIALSLVVMGVLALVSAKASHNLSSKQAESTYEAYTEETAGQFFVRSIDARLNAMRDQDNSPQVIYWVMGGLLDQMASNAIAVTSAEEGTLFCDCSMLTVDELKTEMGIPSDNVFQEQPEGVVKMTEISVETTQEEMDILDNDIELNESEVPEVKTAVAITDDMAEAMYEQADTPAFHSNTAAGYDLSLSEILSGCVGAVRAEFTTSNGRSLLCVIAINEDATYEIMKWQSAKIWNNNSQSETLWLG